MTTFNRRTIFQLGLGLGAALGAGSVFTGRADAASFFRIATGGTSGTYYPIGGLIANAVSNAPDLVLTAQSSNGSVANANAISSGAVESGFVQADVAAWAYSGTGMFDGKPKMENLRLIANLYSESIHLVALKSANINTVADLKGKQVALDEPGSGTLVDARIILDAWGLKESDVHADYLKPNQAAEKMRDGSMDAFFFVGGYPTGAITELAASGVAINIVPIDGPQAESIRKNYSFFLADEIPADAYKGVPAAKTLAVGAQWVTSATVPDDIVYQVAKGLWSDKTRTALDNGHAKGKLIVKANALKGAGIPVHPGAEKFYAEAGMVNN